MSYDNPWLHDNKIIDTPDIQDYIGFVYLITNLHNNKKYIGKKLFKATRRKSVKGKRKKVIIDSNWKEYYGSNEILLAETQKIGYSNFKREILRFCKTRGECSYYEAKYQLTSDCLLNPNEWYNSWISVRIRPSHIKHLVRGANEIDQKTNP